MTFSIVACDLDEQTWGVAVASKFPAVGAVVPFAGANVGAVATQSFANTSFGPGGLELMTKGRRYTLPHATIHMHQPLGGAQGQATDIEIAARQILRQKAILNDILAKSTGQPLEVIERDTDRDYYLDAKGAVDYGLVDQVLEVPEKVEK